MRTVELLKVAAPSDLEHQEGSRTHEEGRAPAPSNPDPGSDRERAKQAHRRPEPVRLAHCLRRSRPVVVGDERVDTDGAEGAARTGNERPGEGQRQCGGRDVRRETNGNEHRPETQHSATTHPVDHHRCHQAADNRADGHRRAVKGRDRARGALIIAEQCDGGLEGVEEVAEQAQLDVGKPGGAVASEGSRSNSTRRDRGHASAVTTWSMLAVSRRTSSGSTEGNIATRNWLRPSLR